MAFQIALSTNCPFAYLFLYLAFLSLSSLYHPVIVSPLSLYNSYSVSLTSLSSIALVWLEPSFLHMTNHDLQKQIKKSSEVLSEFLHTPVPHLLISSFLQDSSKSVPNTYHVV